jgi:hypothetical protein
MEQILFSKEVNPPMLTPLMLVMSLSDYFLLGFTFWLVF